MKIVSMIARYLLGLAFVVFGLNGFLNFIPQPPMPPGPLADYLAVMMKTHYMVPVFALELISGILLLINRYVPLALTFLAPILVNIVIFHVSMQPAGLPPGILCIVCWFLVFVSVRSAFNGILQNQSAA